MQSPCSSKLFSRKSIGLKGLLNLLLSQIVKHTIAIIMVTTAGCYCYLTEVFAQFASVANCQKFNNWMADIGGCDTMLSVAQQRSTSPVEMQPYTFQCFRSRGDEYTIIIILTVCHHFSYVEVDSH